MDRGCVWPCFVLILASLCSAAEASSSEVHDELLDWFKASDVQAALQRLPKSRLESLPSSVRDLLLEANGRHQNSGRLQETYRLLSSQANPGGRQPVWEAGRALEAANTQQESTAGGHGEHHAHEAIAYLVVVLVCGIATYHVLGHHHKIPVPYTVALFLEGQLLGILHSGLDKKHWDTLSNSIEMWVSIDYHVLLYTFLPCLLFGDSLSLNWSLWKYCFTQCFLLAGPGVVIGAGLTALFARFILPYGWDWSTCLTFGSIMAATDPVAVVGLLKELGAAKPLTMQISGEALLNDGFAIVAWTVCFKAMVGESISAGDVVWKFLQLAVGGVGAGWLMGSVLLSWLLRASDKMQEADHVIQIALTITCSYFTFFFAENDLHFSGVLAVVFAALCVSRAAWPLFTDHKGLVVVWHTIEFIGNTIVFVLAGTITGGIMRHMKLADYGWLLVTYTAALIIRGLLIIVFYPVLQRLGPGCNWKDALIMWWGGLRGAVGLALAIAVANNQAVDKQVGTQIAFHVSGLASLTLLVNATTCAPMLKALGMTNKHAAHLEMVEGLQATLKSVTKWSYMALASTEKFSNHDRKALRAYVSSLQDIDDEQEGQDLLALGNELEKQMRNENKDIGRVARAMSLTSEEAAKLNEPSPKGSGGPLSPIQKLARTLQGNPIFATNGAAEPCTQDSPDDTDTYASSPPPDGFDFSGVDASSERQDSKERAETSQTLGMAPRAWEVNGTKVKTTSSPHSSTGHTAATKMAVAAASEDFVAKNTTTSKASADFAGRHSVASRASRDFNMVTSVDSRLQIPTEHVTSIKSSTSMTSAKLSAKSSLASSRRSSFSSSNNGTNSARIAAADVMALMKTFSIPGLSQRAKRDSTRHSGLSGEWFVQDSVACLYLPTERDLFLSILQATYWKFIEDGLIPSQSQATTLLLRSVDYARMHCEHPLADGSALLRNLMCGHERRYPVVGWLQSYAARVLDGDNIGFMIVPCQRGKYHVFDLFALVSFMDAHEMCRMKMAKFHTEKHSDLWKARMKVLEESKLEENVIREFLEDNCIGLEMVTRVRTKQMAFQLLLQQESKVNEWLSLGAIDATDAEELLHEVKLDHKKLLKPWRDIVPSTSSSKLRRGSSLFLTEELEVRSIKNYFNKQKKTKEVEDTGLSVGSQRLASYAMSKPGNGLWSSEGSHISGASHRTKENQRKGSKEKGQRQGSKHSTTSIERGGNALTVVPVDELT